MSMNHDFEEEDALAPALDFDDLDALDDAPIVPPPERMRIGDPKERPEVRVTLELHQSIDQAIAALAGDDARELRYTGHPAGGDPNLFVRSHELVTVIRASKDDKEFARGTPLIRPLTAPSLLERFTRHARFFRNRKPGKRQQEAADLARMAGRDAKPETFEPCLPPAVLVAGVLDRGHWRGVRTLTGISETPFLRDDGTITQEPGYDEATGYLYAPNADYPMVDEAPTQGDAAHALEDLSKVFADFPYADPSHAMVPIAALLTLLARPALRKSSTPAFVFDAATRGSGKTLQCDAVSLIGSGRFAARKGFPEKEEEVEKVISAYALAGSPIILLDNIKRELGGATLEAVVTAREDVELRVLGSTEIRRLPWTSLVLASGNNIFMSEDFARRVLVARLESNLENPEERRDFSIDDLPGFCLKNRAHLVAAALTVLRAYFIGGCPDMKCARWGSFEEWSRLIPHAIVYAGGADVMKARPSSDSAIPDGLRALVVVLENLPRLDPAAKGVTVKELVTMLYTNHDKDGPPDGWDDVREALDVWSQKHNVQEIGTTFRRYVGRVVGGRKLVRYEDKVRKVARWRSEKVCP